eukprot:gene5235-6684_t
MTEAFVYDAIRTPRGKGKKDGSLHEVRPVNLLAGLLKEIPVRTGVSAQYIEDCIMGCVTQVRDQSGDIAMADVSASEIARWFPTTELAHIGDEVADGLWDPILEASRPLALFDGLRTDFSLARLKHYSG